MEKGARVGVMVEQALAEDDCEGTAHAHDIVNAVV